VEAWPFPWENYHTKTLLNSPLQAAQDACQPLLQPFEQQLQIAERLSLQQKLS